jgi:uncharacterized membrane protein YdjX (TVP38/TMEM64 family)
MIGVKRKALCVTLLAAGLAAVVALTPLAEHLGQLVAWVDAHQQVAWVTFVIGYVVAAVLAMPASLLTLAAGLLFGLRLGVVLVFIGSIAGAAAAFLAGRFIARDWVARRIARSPRYRALDLATRSKGFLIVLLARLSPLIPFNLLNYGLSVTAIRFRHYLLATILGMPPVIVLYVYLGTLARNFTDLAAGSTVHHATARLMLGGGFLTTAALVATLAHVATRALKAAMQEADPRDEGSA